jgi:superfamily I DNA/RNA helicase
MRWVRGRDALYAGWEELKLAIEAFRQPADADLAARLRDELWEVVGLYQQEKQRAGQLDFLDLLLSARDLLRHDGARADLQRVYQRIFVDEFQDTDPLQAEILLLLAAADPPSAIGARRGRRPASSTWWATRNNPSTASAAPTPGSSIASARGCAAMAWGRAL